MDLRLSNESVRGFPFLAINSNSWYSLESPMNVFFNNQLKKDRKSVSVCIDQLLQFTNSFILFGFHSDFVWCMLMKVALYIQRGSFLFYLKLLKFIPIKKIYESTICGKNMFPQTKKSSMWHLNCELDWLTSKEVAKSWTDSFPKQLC